jgi:NAD(P)-dependent dehydrogenase (short-subunit alcohol dehydrogenase family)
MHRLQDKTILLAGAGGIGGAIARAYAAEGASLVLGDINLESAQRVVADINRAGHSAIAARLDGADEDSIGEVASLCLTKFGGLHGAHFNFATFIDSDDSVGVGELPIDVYDETIRVNQRGFVLCTRAVLPLLKRMGGGAILYTSSIAAYRGTKSRVAYAMAKAAAHALMRHVAQRYGSQGIRANAIAPGTVMHDKWDAVLTQETKDHLLATQLIKSRLGQPEDIAALSTLLMSEEGSFITGQVMCVDGGATLRP